MTMPQRGPSPSQNVDSGTDAHVRLANARSINSARLLIVGGMMLIFVLTVIGACLGAFFGDASRWGQLSPVIDTVLAIEAAGLGSAIAFYMTKQD
jgi:ABC-type microcin C transport system permease subunit YejE